VRPQPLPERLADRLAGENLDPAVPADADAAHDVGLAASEGDDVLDQHGIDDAHALLVLLHLDTPFPATIGRAAAHPARRGPGGPNPIEWRLLRPEPVTSPI